MKNYSYTAKDSSGKTVKGVMEVESTEELLERLRDKGLFCMTYAEAIGKGYAGADIHLIGNDSGQLAGNMMGNITQIIEGFKGSTGIDPTSVISGMLGAKIAENQ